MKTVTHTLKAAALLLGLSASSNYAKAQEGCDLPNHVSVSATEISCDTYSFSLNVDAGYSINYSQWTVDGTVITGSLTQAVQFFTVAGQHTVCATAIGGASDQPGNICCAKSCAIMNTPEDMAIDSCTVTVDSCSALTDPSQPFLQSFNCDECKTTVMNATMLGPWKKVTYNPHHSQTRTISREYTDMVNCRRCTVTYNITGKDVLDESFGTRLVMADSVACDTLFTKDIPVCLRGHALRMFFFDHPETDHHVSADSGIVVCCQNNLGWYNPGYYLYSEDLPCCFYNIYLHCYDDHPDRLMQPGLLQANSDQPVRSVNGMSLKIIPNPTSSVFHIESGKGLTAYEKVEILDANGRAVLVRNDISSNTSIDATKLSKGAYTVKVSAKSGIATLKLILLD